MAITEKNQTVPQKSSKTAQYNLDRKTAKISASSSGNVSKYEFSTGKDVLPEKDLLEKAAVIKIFDCSPLVSELRTNKCCRKISTKKLDKLFGLNKREVDKEKKKKICAKSCLVYNKNFTLYKIPQH